MSKFGLSLKTIKSLSSVFSKFSNIQEVLIYGSRVKGNYRNGSDIDLVLKGTDLTLDEQLKIENLIDDLMLPYKVDLSIYNKIENQNLLDHIDRLGVIFK